MRILFIFLIFPAVFFVFSVHPRVAAEPITDKVSAPPAITPASRRELVRAVQFLPPHYNPLIQAGHPIYSVAPQLYASPLRFDAEGNARPYLARSWSVSDDGLQVTLNLVENAVFHDGQPITSADVAFSLLALRDNHPFKPLYSSVAKVETRGSHTAIIHLKHSHPVIEVMLGPLFCPILPKHIFDDGHPLADHPANTQPVGSGPFRFHSRPSPDRLELVRHDAFFRPGLPHLNKIIFQAIGIEGDFSLLLNHGAVDLADLLYEGTQGLEGLRSDPMIVVSDIGNAEILTFSLIQFNVRRKPLSDVRVRRALAMVIDRQRLVDLVSDGRDVVIKVPIHNSTPLYTEMDNEHVVDPVKANALLDKAGYVRDEDGKRFSIRLSYFPSEEGMTWLGNYLRYDLQRLLGIEVRIDHAATVQEWGRRTLKGDFDLNIMVLFAFRDPLIGIHRIFHSRSIDKNQIFTNHMGYRNQQVDDLLDQAARLTELEPRRQLYAEFQRMLMRDMPVYTLGGAVLYTAFHRDLIGLEKSSWGALDPFDELYWRIGTGSED
jgi:peptide/nickel transport system substrate-binding protein